MTRAAPFTLTLVAANGLDEALVGETCARAATVPGKMSWLSPGHAAAIDIENPVTVTPPLRSFLDDHKTDIFITPAVQPRKKLLLADMDATIVEGETLDELAAFAGLKDKISAITARAMEGHLDFESALKERVALLKRLDIYALRETLKTTRLTPGAQTLVATMKKHGSTCVLVSGGFTFFTEAVAEKCGFDHHHGNMLDIENGELTGTVAPPILGKEAKAAFLERYRAQLKLSQVETLAIGDGANDIPMLTQAGLGIGFHPKQAVRDTVPNLILHNDLTAILYAQGYRQEEFCAMIGE